MSQACTTDGVERRSIAVATAPLERRVGGLTAGRLARRLRRMDADAAAAFWIVRAESRGLGPGEAALRDAWLAEADNLAAHQHLTRVLALLDAAGAPSGGPTMKPTFAKALDLTAVGLSALCLVHCLALPVLALALPLLASWAHAEWVHVVFVSLAAPIALLALIDWSTGRPASWRLVGLAGAGLALMLAGALELPQGSWERPLTVAGGLLLASAHIANWRRRHAGHHH
jgi:hypothetical protein